MKRRFAVVVGAGLVLLACQNDSRGPTEPSGPQSSAPAARIFSPRSPQPRPSSRFQASPAFYGPSRITYHGGLITSSQHVVTIYWASRPIYSGGPTPGTTGNGSADGSLVGFFLNHLGGSPYYALNTTYYDNNNNHVQNSVTYTRYWASNLGVPPSGSTVSDGAVRLKITEGFNYHYITYDPAAVYLVFSDAGVNLGGGFRTDSLKYCGYHNYFLWGQNLLPVKYAVLPHDYDMNQGISSNDCGGNNSPNNDPGADQEVSVLAHEIEETNTDPLVSAWYDIVNDTIYENADKCIYIYGKLDTLPNGSVANMTLGGKQFRVQQNWEVGTNEACATAYDVGAITLAPNPGSVCTNSSTLFTASALDQAGNPWSAGTMSWSGSGAVISTQASGARQGYANAGNTEGTGTISATLDGITGTASATVAYCPPYPPSVNGPYSLTRYQSGRFTATTNGGGQTPYTTYQFQRQDCPQFDSGCGPWQSWVSTGSNNYWDTVVYSCGVQHIYVRAKVTDSRGNVSGVSGAFYTPISNPC